MLSPKLKSLRLTSIRGHSWSTCVSKTLKIGYKWESLSHCKGMEHEMVKCILKILLNTWWMPFQVTSLGKLLSVLGKYQGLGIDIELLCSWGHPCSASPSLGSSCFISSPYFPAPNDLFSGRCRDVKWGLPKSQTLSISLWACDGHKVVWASPEVQQQQLLSWKAHKLEAVMTARLETQPHQSRKDPSVAPPPWGAGRMLPGGRSRGVVALSLLPCV